MDDPRGEAITARAAELVGGEMLAEGRPGGRGGGRAEGGSTEESVAREECSGRLAPTPWVTLLTLVPLAYLLFRRNLWWRWPLRERIASRRRTEAEPEAAKVRAPRGVAQPG